MTGKKKGLILALFGLFAGMLIGVGVLALKNYIKKELVALLEDEVSASCPCSFEVDDIGISLLTLSAVAKNARIVSEGETKLIFKTIKASFSLARIRERIIPLTHLQLLDGFATGVLEDSPTFKFIDYLSEPLPPEKDTPDRIKLKLQRLTTKNSAFIEVFKNNSLRGEQVSLSMVRDKNDDFILRPFIERLKLVGNSDESTPKTPADIFQLGKVTTKLKIKDGTLDFKNLILALQQTWFEINATADMRSNNKLDGLLKSYIDLKYFNLPNWITSKIWGEGRVSGIIENPTSTGKVRLADGETFEVSPGGYNFLSFDHIQGTYAFDFNNGYPLLDLHQLSAKNSNATLLPNSFLNLDDDMLAAKFFINIKSLEYAAMRAEDITVQVDVDGPLRALESNVHGKVKRLLLGEYIAPDLSYSISDHGDFLAINLAHNSERYGSFSAQGDIDFRGSIPSSKAIAFDLDNFKLLPTAFPEEDPAFANAIKISGAGTLEGPLTLEKLKGAAQITIASRHFEGEAALKGSVQMKGGVLNLDVANDSKSIDGKATFRFVAGQQSRITVALSDFDPKEYNPNLNCMSISTSADYSFNLTTPLLGNGSLELEAAKIGCAPYNLALKEPKTLSIHKGHLIVKGIQLAGTDTALLIDGEITPEEGFDLRAEGSLYLNAILGLVPALDDLRGLLQASFAIRGPVYAPKLEGLAQVTDGEFAIEAANVSANAINGSIELTKDKIDISELVGMLNDGNFELHGQVYPLDFDRSNFKLKLKDIFVVPYENTTVTFSGDLELSTSEVGQTVLQGTVDIENAEFERNLDLVSVLSSIPKYLFFGEQASAQYNTMPDVDLDIGVKATRNILISTTFLGAELKGNLHIRGTLGEPIIRGELATLSGWLGLKDRKFEITSGIIRFQPGYEGPVLEVVGETTVRSLLGDEVFVILEATGLLSSPKITLSSDQGLTEKEILQLITAAGDITDAQLTDPTQKEGTAEETLLEDLKSFNLRRFLTGITRIDSLSLEPTFNTQRGSIEPALVAQKKITEKVSAIGQSFLGTAGQDARLVLQYELTPKLTLSGNADTTDSETDTVLGADLAYTILSSKTPYLRVTVTGNASQKESTLLRAIKINENSRIPSNELNKIAEAAEDFYQSLGYFSVVAHAYCTLKHDHCRNLLLDLREGTQSHIAAIGLEGLERLDLINADKITEAVSGKPATATLLNDLKLDITDKLRSEGFIGARVRASYESIEDTPNAQALHIIVKPGDPVSFTFIGNKQFSAEEFLETINLFSRKQPFGNNTINILAENIERKYREAGFLYATIQHTAYTNLESGRLNYVINIKEEGRVRVSSVTFEGNHALPTDRLEARVAKYQDGVYLQAIFDPAYAVAEQLRKNSGIIKSFYVEEGFPNAAVEYNLDPVSSDASVGIRYRISEGEQFNANSISVVGFPDKLRLPKQPPAPYSIPKANRFIDLLFTTLNDFGYFSADVWSEFNFERHELTIHVEAGANSTIGEIFVLGNDTIPTAVVLETLVVQAGDAWDIHRIRESRRKLLKSGLFSRVELGSADDDLDNDVEDLLIRLNERALQTLKIGGGLSSVYGLHVFGEATDKTLFKDGKSLGLRLDAFYDDTQGTVSRGVANLRYSDPDALFTSHILTEDVRFQRFDLSTYEFDLDRISLASYLSRSWNSGFSNSFGHTIFQENLDNVSPDAVLSDLDTGTIDLSFISGSLRYDKRDNQLRPKSGYSLSVDYTLAADVLGSDASYYMLEGQASYLYPWHLFEHRFVLAVNNNTASAWTFAGTSEVPISQRYYLGGRNSVRGFRENSLGPRGDDGSILGGDFLISNNLELRYLYGNSTSFHLFFDAGTVYLKERSTAFDDLRTSTGIGLRYLSPIGPIGVDVGHPLDERDGEPSIRVHFVIGANF
ncbi:translocation/assembly module TamB domain-containing protein [Oligoflexia bacterium]|nr:translocation/assembly module TamB domain-containing protein [Oligoflexia bacterium]